MKESDEINKAKTHVEGLLKLGKEIQDATPYLININQNLDWYNSVYGVLEDKQDQVISIIKGPLDELSSFNYSEFTLSAATGFTGTFLTATVDTSILIRESGQKHQFLLDNLKNINPIESTIENILVQVNHIDNRLYVEFNDVKQCYSQWLADLKTNSDLAKDARTFQEHYNGILNMLRVPKKDWATTKFKKSSWNKIVDALCKKGSEQKNSFLKQQKIGEDIWEAFTKIMKKTSTISKDEMGDQFKLFIDHIYAINTLIDDRILYQ